MLTKWGSTLSLVLMMIFFFVIYRRQQFAGLDSTHQPAGSVPAYAASWTTSVGVRGEYGEWIILLLDW